MVPVSKPSKPSKYDEIYVVAASAARPLFLACNFQLCNSIPVAGQEIASRKHCERPICAMLLVFGTVICTSCTMQG